MEKVFRSKIGVEFIILTLLSLAIPIWLIFRTNVSIGISLFVLLFLLTLYLSFILGTYYKIESGKINVICGFIFKWTVDIDSIMQIKRTFNPISSPALSVDRIKILYGNNEWLLISPKNRKGFVEEVKKWNNKIFIVGKV